MSPSIITSLHHNITAIVGITISPIVSHSSVRLMQCFGSRCSRIQWHYVPVIVPFHCLILFFLTVTPRWLSQPVYRLYTPTDLMVRRTSSRPYTRPRFDDVLRSTSPPTTYPERYLRSIDHLSEGSSVVLSSASVGACGDLICIWVRCVFHLSVWCSTFGIRKLDNLCRWAKPNRGSCAGQVYLYRLTLFKDIHQVARYTWALTCN